MGKEIKGNNDYDIFEDDAVKKFFDELHGYSDSGHLKKSTPKSKKKTEGKDEYQKVTKYEVPTKDANKTKSWKPFKVGLCLLLLSGALALGKTAYDKVDEYLTEEETGVLGDDITVETANDEQIEIAQNKIDSIKETSGYEFENLSKEELLDAVFKIPSVEEEIHISTYRSHFSGKDRDQELLEEILKRTYGEEEFATYSPEKIQDLKKMAYELLASVDTEKQQWVRDPERVKEALERQKENSKNVNNTTLDEREIGD